MIVDDDAGTRLVLSTRLRAHHYDVVMASDALQAITIVRKESPNFLILDIGLPGGDGFLVVQRLKAIPAFASIPIIIIRPPWIRVCLSRRLWMSALRRFFQSLWSRMSFWRPSK